MVWYATLYKVMIDYGMLRNIIYKVMVDHGMVRNII